MEISDSEREFLLGMRALTMTKEGYEIFVGLTPEESLEYLEYSRQDETGHVRTAEPSERFAELRQKHEAARQAIVNGDAPLHP